MDNTTSFRNKEQAISSAKENRNMKQEMLMLEPTSYGLEGCSFLLYDIEIRGHNAIKSERGFRLEYPDQAPSAVASGTRLAQEIKASLASAEGGDFEEEMESLRGRLWLS